MFLGDLIILKLILRLGYVCKTPESRAEFLGILKLIGGLIFDVDPAQIVITRGVENLTDSHIIEHGLPLHNAHFEGLNLL